MEENSQTPVILRSSTDTSYLKDRFFVLVRFLFSFSSFFFLERGRMICACVWRRACIHQHIFQSSFFNPDFLTKYPNQTRSGTRAGCSSSTPPAAGVPSRSSTGPSSTSRASSRYGMDMALLGVRLCRLGMGHQFKYIHKQTWPVHPTLPYHDSIHPSIDPFPYPRRRTTPPSPARSAGCAIPSSRAGWVGQVDNNGGVLGTGDGGGHNGQRPTTDASLADMHV